MACESTSGFLARQPQGFPDLTLIVKVENYQKQVDAKRGDDHCLRRVYTYSYFNECDPVVYSNDNGKVDHGKI